MVGGLIMVNNDLLEEIINGYNDGYDMESSLCSWIDEDIFILFDEFLSKGIVLTDEEKKELLNQMASINPSFFNDRINILYLKLINLYNKNQRVNGDNQELYYLVDHFSPKSTDTSIISKQLQELLKNKDFKSYIETNFNYESVLTPYSVARNQAKTNTNDTADSETFTEISDTLDKVIKQYNDEDYVYEMIEDNRKGDFAKLISKLNINMLARVYCEVNGNEFTKDEKEILSSELSQTQKSTLSDAISGRKK